MYVFGRRDNMRNIRKTVCALLAVIMLTSLASCAASAEPFDHQTMTDFCGELGFEECSDPDELFNAYSRILFSSADGEGAYITASGDEANDVYSLFMNRFTDMPSYDVDEATTFICSGDDGFFMGFVYTFEDAKEAGKFYKRFVRNIIDDGKQAEEKGCTYALSATINAIGESELYSIYLKDKTVLIVRGICKDTRTADDLCTAYGVRSPSEEL